MNTHATRGRIARDRRRKSLDFDLNSIPPAENQDLVEESQLVVQEAQVNQQQSLQLTVIDVEVIDDDVVESTATAFAEAKNKSRRNPRNYIVDVDAVAEDQSSRVSNNNRSKRRRVVSNQQTVNSNLLINLETSNRSTKQKLAPPRKEMKFSCPICMCPFVEETSTRCGHIFCKACIRAAIAVKCNCPTCREKVTAKELIRVYLPGTSLV